MIPQSGDGKWDVGKCVSPQADKPCAQQKGSNSIMAIVGEPLNDNSHSGAYKHSNLWASLPSFLIFCSSYISLVWHHTARQERAAVTLIKVSFCGRQTDMSIFIGPKRGKSAHATPSQKRNSSTEAPSGRLTITCARVMQYKCISSDAFLWLPLIPYSFPALVGLFYTSLPNFFSHIERNDRTNLHGQSWGIEQHTFPPQLTWPETASKSTSQRRCLCVDRGELLHSILSLPLLVRSDLGIPFQLKWI